MELLEFFPGFSVSFVGSFGKFQDAQWDSAGIAFDD